MKNQLAFNFTKIIYTLFIISTIISIVIVYRDIESPIAFKFVMAYIIFVFFFLLYFPLVTIIKLRKLKWIEIRKRLIRFITIFILLGISNFTFDYFFRPSNVNLFREFSIPLGLAFGISFLDIALKNGRDNI